jgi:hypothetical protein
MGFRFKTANFWLPQFGSRPFPHLASSELDEALIADYRRYLPRAKEAGFDNLLIFGLIGEGGPNQMPADLERGFSRARDRQIRQVIDLIHDAGLKFLAGLGVYSWGFTNIIRAHPEVAGRAYRFRGIGSGYKGDHGQRNNLALLADYDRLEMEDITPRAGAEAWGVPVGDVLCASREESWYWQEQVIRFMLDRYDIDGFHTESADKGRCFCPECRQLENITYHVGINERTNECIKRLAPDCTLAVNPGVFFDGLRDLPALRRMASGADCFLDRMDGFHILGDYLIGPNKVLLNDRPVVAQALAPVPFGSFISLRDAGLERTTWFSPAPRSVVETIAAAYRDGLRGFEYYALGAFNNAGHELNTYVAGHALNQPEVPWHDTLEAVVDRLYRPTAAAVRTGLADLFAGVELSCFYNRVRVNMAGGADHYPVRYLLDTTPFFLLRHLRELQGFRKEAIRLRREVRDAERGDLLIACIDGTTGVLEQELTKHLGETVAPPPDTGRRVSATGEIE